MLIIWSAVRYVEITDGIYITLMIVIDTNTVNTEKRKITDTVFIDAYITISAARQLYILNIF